MARLANKGRKTSDKVTLSKMELFIQDVYERKNLASFTRQIGSTKVCFIFRLYAATAERLRPVYVLQVADNNNEAEQLIMCCVYRTSNLHHIAQSVRLSINHYMIQA